MSLAKGKRMSDSIIQAQQSRSLDTQNKLIDALYQSLRHKYFEQISIKELSEIAGVSVGTFYRRFKNKDALLPLLYQSFGAELEAWVEHMESQRFTTLKAAVTDICMQTHEFLSARQGVFRTLHLNTRLHSEILKSDNKVNRSAIYQRITQIICSASDSDTVAITQDKAATAVFTMIASLLEKTVYPEMTPAIACEQSSEEFAKELPKILLAYLTA